LKYSSGSYWRPKASPNVLIWQTFFVSMSLSEEKYWNHINGMALKVMTHDLCDKGRLISETISHTFARNTTDLRLPFSPIPMSTHPNVHCSLTLYCTVYRNIILVNHFLQIGNLSVKIIFRTCLLSVFDRFFSTRNLLLSWSNTRLITMWYFMIGMSAEMGWILADSWNFTGHWTELISQKHNTLLI
jgi:hypothetical protein